MPSKQRFELVDWIRGFSILLMIIYHFCYDLDFFGYIDTAFGHGYWKPFRYVIVIGFLSMVGVSLVLVHQNKLNKKSLVKRTLQLGIASLFVSLSGLFIDSNKITVFGILHFILVASFLALPFVNFPKTSFVVGIIIFVLGHTVHNSFFDPVWLHWIGMVETKRAALDYVPLFPWLGAVLVGITLGHLIKSHAVAQQYAQRPALSRWHEFRGFKLFDALLVKMGRHSLIIYLVHQPLMFGIFYLFSTL